MRELIAITGIIGSGKTTVAHLLREKGYHVVDCDRINSLLFNEEEYLSKLRVLFPETRDRNIDKRLIAEIVFSDESKRKLLNELAHPIIMERALAEAKKFEGTVFVEIPLFFGSGYESYFKKVWIVTSSDEVRLERILKRDKRSKEEAQAIIQRQKMTVTENDNYCVINNDGDIRHLSEQLDRLLCTIE
ncbi:MAG: dephospho-CoA kinase [Clostridia bacterium]|nr:dephospho-CoA kinase [Clostridia bacterium]